MNAKLDNHDDDNSNISNGNYQFIIIIIILRIGRSEQVCHYDV